MQYIVLAVLAGFAVGVGNYITGERILLLVKSATKLTKMPLYCLCGTASIVLAVLAGFVVQVRSLRMAHNDGLGMH